MIEIIFLGTSSMQPTKERNHSSFLLRYGQENIVFDCGEGTQRQMRIAGIKPAKITKILISHWHGDHVFGIAGLISAMGADGYKGKLNIYGPAGTKNYLKHLFQSFSQKEKINLEVHEIISKKVVEEEKYLIEAYPLKHSAKCLGYAFIEKAKRKIDLNKAKKLNISGPVLGKLQKGESIKIENKIIRPEELTNLIKGKKIGYIADTLLCPGVKKIAATSDLLISEGTHLDEIKEKNKQYMHLTVKQAAEIAAENNVNKLIITHISQRYKDNKKILEEAKKYFKNSFVAKDFMKIKL